MATEELKAFIENCFRKRKELEVQAIAIVLEENIASCVAAIQTSSLKHKEEFENTLKNIDGKIIRPFQLHKVRKYFQTHEFKTSFSNDTLIIKKY